MTGNKILTPLAVIDVGGGGGGVAAVSGHYTIITPELARGHVSSVSSVPSGHPSLALVPGRVYCYDQSSYESDDAHSSEPHVPANCQHCRKTSVSPQHWGIFGSCQAWKCWMVGHGEAVSESGLCLCCFASSGY